MDSSRCFLMGWALRNWDCPGGLVSPSPEGLEVTLGALGWAQHAWLPLEGISKLGDAGIHPSCAQLCPPTLSWDLFLCEASPSAGHCPQPPQVTPGNSWGGCLLRVTNPAAMSQPPAPELSHLNCIPCKWSLHSPALLPRERQILPDPSLLLHFK